MNLLQVFLCVQVRLLKSQLDQRPKNGTDGVQNPEGGSLENGMDSHLLDLQSKYQPKTSSSSSSCSSSSSSSD